MQNAVISFDNLKHILENPKWRRRMPMIALAIAGVLLLLGAWGLTSSIIEMTKTDPETKIVPKQKKVEKAPLPTISKWHIFGIAEKKVAEIPTSTLNLSLAGIFLKEAPEESSVIIVQSNKNAKLYYVGDSLPGGIKVYKIHPNSVVLERDGKLERLSFKKKLLQQPKLKGLKFER